MPIGENEFDEKGTEIEIGAERIDRKKQVKEYMAKRSQKAFTQKEIGDAVEIQSTHARSVLMSLVEDAEIERRACKDEDGKTLIYYKYIKVADR